MKTFTDETQARDYAQRKTRRSGGREVYVVVDGPDDGEWTVMSLTDTIDGEFLYSW